MNTFEFHTPATLDEAYSLLDEHGDDANIMAGGTGLVLFMKQRMVQPGHLVSLRAIPGMDHIRVEDGAAHIGALCTMHQVETSPQLREVLPLLGETYRHVASVKIRNMATVGGGLSHGDPNQDPPPSLIALGASVVLSSASGRRIVPVDEFFTDYFETDINEGEIVTELVVPLPSANSGSAFIKFLPRTADDYATVSAAAVVSMEEGNRRCRDARVALGSVATTPIRARRVEDALRGRELTQSLIKDAADLVQDEVDPLDDFRGSSGYKRQMAQVFAKRALEAAVARVPAVPA
jgi:carbon-monoxide dehydrogenase medium subunit